MKSERCSVVSDSAKFSRPEYWGGKPFPSPGHLPTPGLPHCRQILYQMSYQGSPKDEKMEPIFESWPIFKQLTKTWQISVTLPSLLHRLLPISVWNQCYEYRGSSDWLHRLTE